MKLQRSRRYKLTIGNYETGDGVLIEDLQVTFDISKSTNNKNRTNSASIEVYNLSEANVKLLDTDYPAAVLEAGYQDTTGVRRIFAGQVTHVGTRKSGTDTITQITMGSGYTTLNHQLLSEFAPVGTDIKMCLKRLGLLLEQTEVFIILPQILITPSYQDIPYLALQKRC